MSLVDFLYSLKSAIDWAINSKFVFACISTVCVLIFLWLLACELWRFVRDRYIFPRHRGRDL